MLALVVAFAAGPSLERAVQIPSRCDTSDDQAAVALPARPQAQRADGGVQISDIDAPRQAGSPITPSEVLKSVDPLGPVPCSAQTTIAHRFDPIAPAEFNERRPDRRHFQIGWTEGYQTNHLGSVLDPDRATDWFLSGRIGVTDGSYHLPRGLLHRSNHLAYRRGHLASHQVMGRPA